MKILYKYSLCLLFVTLLHIEKVVAQRDFAMQITVDKPVEAEDVVLFPGVKDKDSYWYMSKNVKLATNEDGSPKVSFVKWVYNEDNGEDEGLGGGVLHCVFGYGATTEQLNKARTALRRINGKGKIVGPVIFKSGTVTVAVPKLNDPEKQEVVAVAPAPTIQGAYVATNLQLDKRSASLLWESFDTPNPLVTFNFNMELAGYNSPLEAKITINREQIHNSRRMQAGVATPWLAAEVGSFFDEMIDNGAIEIEKIGENFEMQEAIDRAVEMATQEFFTPLGSSDGPNLSQLQGLNGQEPSFLDRASGVLNTARQDARSENQRIRSENRQAEDRAERRNQRIREENRRERERVDRVNEQNRERIERERREAQENEDEEDSEEDDEGEDDEENHDEDNTQVTPTEAGITPENVSQDVYIPIEAEQRDEVTANTRDEESVPSIAIVASYIQREVRISGKKVISFKETYPTTIPMPFGGNLGVSRKDCAKCFLEVNLNDPVFKQRQLLAVIDGFNQDNFSQFINYASLQIKKTHQSGKTTFDEVRVTRKNFNDEGNLFTLLYGWNGDNDRSKWLDYEYKVGWSFFGGKEFETDWINSNKNTINLSAPLQQKVITIEAERDLLEEANVRSIDVKIIYNLGGEDLQKQFTVNTSKDVLNGQVVIMLPKNKQEYDYEVTWRLWGGKEVKSGRKTTSFEVLQIDELPN
ncbi:hypothetical protein [Hyunsoonleella pacifica]|uniref:Uncharacterized protein n=1 Tax=Hyunsoonleella pacifica TaxID=1080224 RepID=A0A4Q9FQG7_9FLAO|nr:hypothetical protein [Hyunsoonleella pacifica]TBN17503.1 hypothetical protein EYD46_04085 [Hyunsoonleella pacifica]GGD11452.1 hypothetical protein GCM10011368_11760 [Hyunsoonleella pacifica]